MVVVVGLGNELMGDDGIGLAVARKLMEESGPAAPIVIAGLPGFDLLDLALAVRMVIFIDAVDGGRLPGSVFWVDAWSDLLKETGKYSLHQVGLGEVLGLMALDENAPDIRIIGVQPENIGPKERLSTALWRRLPRIIDETRQMIEAVLVEERRADRP